MSKPHKWAKEIKAWADGAEVQYKDGRDWLDVDEPVWNAKSAEYRIKPQPKEPQYIYFFRRGMSSPFTGFNRNDCVSDEQVQYVGKIKLETEDE